MVSAYSFLPMRYRDSWYNSTMAKKVLVVFAVILCLLWTSFVLFGAKNKQEFIFWTIQLKPICNEIINKNIAEFERKHPEIKVVWIDIPIAEAQKRTLASILGGNPPDLINLNPDFSVLLAQKGSLEFFDEEHTSQYHPELVNKLRYEGKVFALPFYATSPVTLYNKKLIASAPKTYEDVLKNSYTLSINLNENDTFARILNKYDIYDSKTLITKGDEPFNLFKQMYDKGYISKDALTINHREVVEKYMSKNAAVIVVGSNFIKMVEENAQDVYKNSAVSPQLTGPNGKYDIALMNLIIPTRAKNKALAKEFALQLTNADNQLEFAKLTNVLPANKVALNNPYFKNCSEENLVEKARCVSTLQLNNLVDKNFGYENKKTINDTINSSVEKYLLEGTAPIESLAHEIKNLQNKE